MLGAAAGIIIKISIVHNFAPSVDRISNKQIEKQYTLRFWGRRWNHLLNHYYPGVINHKIRLLRALKLEQSPRDKIPEAMCSVVSVHRARGT